MVLVARGNRLLDLRPLMPAVLELLPAMVAGQVIKVGGQHGDGAGALDADAACW